jgi:L-asparaginase/Glu-tRNA(Gln) amidotransferase subunit D
LKINTVQIAFTNETQKTNGNSPAGSIRIKCKEYLKMKKIVVAGTGGFIAGHLVNELTEKGYSVRAVDIKPLNEWYQVSDKADNLVLDLRLRENCYKDTIHKCCK